MYKAEDEVCCIVLIYCINIVYFNIEKGQNKKNYYKL